MNKWEGLDPSWSSKFDNSIYRIDKFLWQCIQIPGNLGERPCDIDAIIAWLNSNELPCLIDRSGFPDMNFWFPNKEDAMAFKIMWV